jgi:hypothetical protein
MNKMTAERAGQIALAIIKQTWPNRGIDLSQEEFESRLSRLQKQSGINQLNLAHFFAEELLASAFERCTKVMIEVKVLSGRSLEANYNARGIALALLIADGFDFRPDQFQPRLKRLTESTGIPLQELEDFYIQEIIPHGLAVATGKDCKVVVSERPPSPDIGQPQ